MNYFKKLIVGIVFAFEGARLVGWIWFISYLARCEFSLDRSNEAMIFTHMVALYLGFPYEWIGGVIMDGVGLMPRTPLLAAFVQALFWLLGVIVLILALSRISHPFKQTCRDSP